MKDSGELRFMSMISVIIPVCNTKQYLHDCFASIIAQTYTNLEILFVDDGSTDGSGEVLDYFVSVDKRVRVIHQENSGVGAARNRGIEEANGEYLSFVDSDDTLEPDLYETLIKLLADYQVQVSHCSYNRIRNGTVRAVGNTGQVYVQSRKEALLELTCGKLFMGGCWNKLYARKLFDEIRFDTSLKLSEDELLNFQIFNQVDTIVYYDVCKYNYLDSTTSACRNTHSLRKACDHVEVARRILTMNDIEELDLPLRRKLMGAYIQYYKNLVCEKSHDYVLLKDLSKKIEQLKLEGAELSGKQKLMYGLMRFCPPAFRILYGVYDRNRIIE